MWLTSDNHRIQVFTAEGEFLRMFGRRGQGRGELAGPVGIAIDSSDMVYVSEWHNRSCLCVHLRGSVCDLINWRVEGWDLESLNCPAGLAVDNSGVLYVCDSGHGSVKVF